MAYKRDSNTYKIDSLLNFFLEENGMKDSYHLFLVRKHFKLLVASEIHNTITDFYITKNKTLHIHIISAAMKDSLMLQRESIIDKINNAIGISYLKKISIH